MNNQTLLKLVICDDEPLFLEQIQEFLHNILPKAELWTIETMSPDKFKKMLENSVSKVNLAIMDIDFTDSDFDGIDLAQKLNMACPECQIVYLTSYIQFATKVYDTSHVYYVLKNEMAEFLPKAIKKACQKIFQNPATVTFTLQGQHIVIPFSSLYYIEKQKGIKKAIIYTSHKNYVVNLTLSELENHCSTLALIRCHHSFLVNPQSVIEFRNTSLLMKNMNIVPVGRTFRKRVREAYLNYLKQKLHSP